jgi:hypothetical protein
VQTREIKPTYTNQTKLKEILLMLNNNKNNNSDNTSKMDLREIGWDGLDWIELAQDRDLWRALVNMVMNLQVP